MVSDAAVENGQAKPFASYLLDQQKRAMNAFLDENNSAGRWSPVNDGRQSCGWSQLTSKPDYDLWSGLSDTENNVDAARRSTATTPPTFDNRWACKQLQQQTLDIAQLLKTNNGVIGAELYRQLQQQQQQQQQQQSQQQRAAANGCSSSASSSFVNGNGELCCTSKSDCGGAERRPITAATNGVAAVVDKRNLFTTAPDSEPFFPINSAAAARTKRSMSLTPPSGQTFANGWSPLSGASDVFSQMNTFNAKNLSQNGDDLSSYQNGFPGRRVVGSGSSSSSGSNSGSASCNEQSESPVQRNSFLEPGSGMRDVPAWLKGLRLHKYCPLFSQLTYNEMVQLTEEQLETQGVTKGARHKIVLSVQKLRDRISSLKQLDKELNESGSLKSSVNELKSIIGTPIRVYTGPSGWQNLVDVDQTLIDGLDVPVERVDDENLPAHITRVLSKTCTKILSEAASAPLDDECVGTCLYVLDRVQSHEAFTSVQKRRIASFKQQIRRLWTPVPRKLAPRSNSWNKDRRQSLGNGSLHNGNGVNHSLHRQSSLGNSGGCRVFQQAPGSTTSGLMNGMAFSISVGESPLASTTCKSVASNCVTSATSCIDRPIWQTAAPSYASAVSGHNNSIANGNNSQSHLPEKKERCSPPAAIGGRPVQRTISEPLSRSSTTAATENGTVTSAVLGRANANGDFSYALVPPYCWPPSSVFSGGPLAPPTQQAPPASRSAWSCGFEETAVGSYSLGSAMAAPVNGTDSCFGGFFDYQLNAYGAANGAGNDIGMLAEHGFAYPQGAPYTSDWNLPLDQLCRSITEAAIGGIETP